MRSNLREDLSVEKTGHNRRLLPVLALSIFSVWLITISFQLLLVDIAKSFQVNVGVAGQVFSICSLSGVVAGLMMSILSVRFNHKLLLIMGLTSTCAASVGLFLAPAFDVFLLSSIGVGTGIAVVTAMSYSFVGDCLPLQKRSKAIGWLVASSTLAAIVGAPVIGLIASTIGWRSVVIWLALPFALASLALVLIVVPNKRIENGFTHRESLFAGLKRAFRNRSATACLFVTMFSISQAILAFFSISFFRTQFSIDMQLGAIIVLIDNTLFVIGCIAAGLLANRIGLKILGIIALSTAILISITFTFMSNFMLSWSMSTIRFWLAGIFVTSLDSLVIEQIPKSRATMTALNTTFLNVGMLLASASAGLVLYSFNYQAMAVTLGCISSIGLVVWITLVKDTTKN